METGAFWFGIIAIAICFPSSVIIIFKYLHNLSRYTSEEINLINDQTGFGDILGTLLVMAMLFTPIFMPVKYQSERMEPTLVTKGDKSVVADFEYKNEFRNLRSELVNVYYAEEHVIVITRYRTLSGFDRATLYELEVK